MVFSSGTEFLIGSERSKYEYLMLLGNLVTILRIIVFATGFCFHFAD
jgi:hypothetical protein